MKKMERRILPVSSRRKLNVTTNTNMKHIMSNVNPNAELVDMNMYQHAVCVSC